LSHVEPHHAAVLSGSNPGGAADGPLPSARERVAAVWAYAHDLAADAFGAAAPFFSERGPALLAALEAAPEGSTCDELIDVVRGHLTAALETPEP